MYKRQLPGLRVVAVVGAEAREWCVELYSKAKHDAGEAAVEAVLSGMPVPFNKNEIGPTEDGPHMTAWYFETNEARRKQT